MKLKELWAIHDFLSEEIDYQMSLVSPKKTLVTYLTKKLTYIIQQIEQEEEDLKNFHLTQESFIKVFS